LSRFASNWRPGKPLGLTGVGGPHRLRPDSHRSNTRSGQKMAPPAGIEPAHRDLEFQSAPGITVAHEPRRKPSSPRGLKIGAPRGIEPPFDFVTLREPPLGLLKAPDVTSVTFTLRTSTADLPRANWWVHYRDPIRRVLTGANGSTVACFWSHGSGMFRPVRRRGLPCVPNCTALITQEPSAWPSSWPAFK